MVKERLIEPKLKVAEYDHIGITEILPKVHFHKKDVLQVIIGASILAIPVGFTEETWRLGEILPIQNILIFFFISLIFISSFSYLHYYRGKLAKHFKEFIKRTIFTYLLAFLVVALLLALIQKAPWSTDLLLAIKRTVIVTFPASLSGVIADTLR